MKVLARLTLYVAASVFAGFGALFMIAPGQITGFVQVAVPTPIAAMEIRGVYGGLFFGLGIFFALCASLLPLRRAGLVGLATVMGGLILGRTIGFVVDGPSIPFIYLLYAGEIVGFVIAVVALPATNVN